MYLLMASRYIIDYRQLEYSLLPYLINILTIDNILHKLNKMPVLIALQMYPVKEICSKLAKIKGRHDYTRQQIAFLIKKKIPTAQKFGNVYYLTEPEIVWLASEISTRRK